MSASGSRKVKKRTIYLRHPCQTSTTAEKARGITLLAHITPVGGRLTWMKA